MRNERGFTVIELLVSMASFIVVFGAISAIAMVAMHNQNRIADRVSANQRARPVMTRMIDQLHSSCVAQRVAPIQVGSTGTSITFLSKAGSSATPLPDQRTITLSGTNLVETVRTGVGGQPPVWTYSTPSAPRRLMDNVTAPGGVVFRYYKYVNGALSTTPLATPLNTADAASAAYVTINLTVAQAEGVSSQDPNAPITISDGADLRLESAGQVTSQENLPCM